MLDIDVVIPTRNRPRQLSRCLEALAKAREQLPFRVVISDSSDVRLHTGQVEQLCAEYDFVRLSRHGRRGVAAGRNHAAKVASGDLLINVDDDVYVEPDAIAKLYESYQHGSGWRVVAGAVRYRSGWTAPVVMRPIGYGRAARPGELPSFLIGAFFLYPRALALSWPWPEQIASSDDRFMGALWRNKGVAMLFAPDALARHDDAETAYGPDHYESHIYANLFDALIANPRPLRAVSYELLGLMFGLKAVTSPPTDVLAFIAAWYRGHRALLRDWSYLHDITSGPLPASSPP